MVPCYIDVFYPEVGIAALELLEKLGVEVEYPFDQTCCGQPMANSGCEAESRATSIPAVTSPPRTRWPSG
jgi:L-lactate dehydrogenase complex protein LldE